LKKQQSTRQEEISAGYDRKLAKRIKEQKKCRIVSKVLHFAFLDKNRTNREESTENKGKNGCLKRQKKQKIYNNIRY